MLIVKYTDEAERKRLEYVVDRYKDKVKAVRPSGTVLLLEGDREMVSRLVEELYSRLPREKISIYRLAEPDVEVEEKRSTIEAYTSLPEREVWGAIGLIMARLRGGLVSETRGVREYVVRPRGGYARVRISVYPRGGGSIIRVFVEGFDPAHGRVVSSLVEELGLLGDVRHAGDM
ncbi:MAG: hypothetical protein GSR81_00965 [Desulfurococcales archaeon]|nr:hypothetical protein [Desulfurococcales archaeon]